jgi:hypothetical protein
MAFEDDPDFGFRGAFQEPRPGLGNYWGSPGLGTGGSAAGGFDWQALLAALGGRAPRMDASALLPFLRNAALPPVIGNSADPTLFAVPPLPVLDAAIPSGMPYPRLDSNVSLAAFGNPLPQPDTGLRQGTDGFQPAAYGDLKCEVCPSGGTYGTTGMYKVFGRTMCQDCAVKALGLDSESPAERLRVLMRHLLGGK